jgi:hypothetical protein
MAFTKDQLLLPADKAAQLTKALTTLGVADPLQYLCDEAAAVVARMTTGYVLDDASLRNFTRSLALFQAYSKSGTGAPKNIQDDNAAAMKELEAIAKGERPNLPKVAVAAVTPITGSSGSNCKIKGRIPGQV